MQGLHGYIADEEYSTVISDHGTYRHRISFVRTGVKAADTSMKLRPTCPHVSTQVTDTLHRHSIIQRHIQILNAAKCCPSHRDSLPRRILLRRRWILELRVRRFQPDLSSLDTREVKCIWTTLSLFRDAIAFSSARFPNFAAKRMYFIRCVGVKLRK